MSKDQRAKDFMAYLRETYPVLGDPRPMGVGIHAEIHRRHARRSDNGDLQEGEERPGVIWTALKIHTGSRAYQEALAAGGPRYDLDGNPVSEVTEDQQEHARQQLQALKDRKRKRGGKKAKPNQQEAKEAPAQEADAGEAPNDGKIRLNKPSRRRRGKRG